MSAPVATPVRDRPTDRSVERIQGWTVPDFFTDGQGRVRPITKKKGGAGAAAPAAAEVGVGSVRLGGSSGQLRARKSEGRKAARRGEVEGAWQRMGLRQVKRTAKQQAECVAVSFGQVRQFFTAHRCTHLERVLFAVADEAGNTAVVSVAWVGLANARDAREFDSLVEIHGSGDITPPAGAAVTVAEAENAAGGQFDHDTLDAIAEVAAYLPRL